MTSDFATARAHLERAYQYLRGDDETSRHAREALDILCEAVTMAEYCRPTAEVIRLSSRIRKSRPPR